MIENAKLKTASNIALLAPVPLEHLTSALEVLEVEEKVAFGSKAFLVFHELDRQRKGLSGGRLYLRFGERGQQ